MRVLADALWQPPSNEADPSTRFARSGLHRILRLVSLAQHDAFVANRGGFALRSWTNASLAAVGGGEACFTELVGVDHESDHRRGRVLVGVELVDLERVYREDV